MENPQRDSLKWLRLLILGGVIGGIPGLIRVQQLDRQIETERADVQARMLNLQSEANEMAERATNEKRDCDAAIMGDSGRTVLVDVNHPYGPEIQQLLGVSLTLPPRGNPAFATGPIWVVPRTITPHVVDGVLGGLYTHIWPNGRNDGWHMPARAE